MKTTHTRRRKWTEESILQAIKTRLLSSQHLNARTVEVDDSALIAAARRIYGSWSNALMAAGVDPTSVRASSKRRPRGTWSREAVIQEIRRYAGNATPLHAHHMQQVDNALVSAATYYFGTWSLALEAAGEDAQSIRQNIVRDRDQIIEAIRELAETETSLRDFSVRNHDRALYGAAQKYFGSWRKALRASGVEALGIGQNSRWTREDIQSVVLEYVGVGYPLNRVFRRHSHLKAAILREWGSIEVFQKELAWDLPAQSDHIGKIICDILATRGMTCADLANQIGIPVAVLEAYKHGSIPLPLFIADRIAVALEVPLDTIMRGLG